MGETSELRCPRCRCTVARGKKSFPFCSERCRLVDLGRWFSEDYRVGRPLSLDDELQLGEVLFDDPELGGEEGA